jgi:hypothetical protein
MKLKVRMYLQVPQTLKKKNLKMKDLTCENFSLQIPYLKTEWMKMWG